MIFGKDAALLSEDNMTGGAFIAIYNKKLV